MLSRRRALCLIGAAASAAGLPHPLWARELKRIRWRGAVLGTLGAITLYHDDQGAARALIAACVAEIARLERMVSLYRADSLINRLNREGRLAAPPLELIHLLREAQAIGDLTGGAFDVTVQPLWRLYAAHFASAGADPNGPSPRAIEAASRLVDYRDLDVASARLRLARAGMALTLNGIAQGWITDRVAERLRDGGLSHVLVDLGEQRAIAGRSAGAAWRIGLDGIDQPIELTDGALASSSPRGTVFEPSGRFNHLFDPRSGRSAAQLARVSVRAPSALRADALSTAFAVMSVEHALRLARALEVDGAHMVEMNGRAHTVGRRAPAR